MRLNLEETFDEHSPTENNLLFKGNCTFESPCKPSAFKENFELIADEAKQRGEPVCCQFEESNFRIHPDGNVEWARCMPPLRDEIRDIIESALKGWREKHGEST